MKATFTYEQIEKILEEAMQNSLQPVDERNLISDYIQKAFNNGVRLMMKETLYQVILREIAFMEKGA